MKNKNNILIYSFLSGYKVNFIGKLAFGDIFAVIFSLYSINKIKELYKKLRDLKKIHNSLFCFLLFQIFSDFYNNIPLFNSLRGLANILMCIFVLIYLILIFYNSINPLSYLFFGFALSSIIFGVDAINNNAFSLNDMGFFKLRLVPFFNNIIFFLIIYLSSSKNFKFNIKQIAIIFISFGIFCIFFQARSNGLFFIISGFLVFNKNFISKLSFKNWSIILFILFSFQLLYSFYIFSILNGDLKSSQTKSQIDNIHNPYNPLELLFSGRIEIYGSIAAIMDKPIIGHGSWATDKKLKYNIYLINNLNVENQNIAYNYLNNFENDKILIPTHSILFGSWVSAGIGGFLSLLYIYLLIIKRAFQLFNNLTFIQTVYFPITVFFFLNFIWIFIFSPLQELKSTVPFIIILIIKFNNILKHENNKFN